MAKRGKFSTLVAAQLLAGTSILTAGVVATPAYAQQATINIPSQSAPGAITKLAKQTGTQILFDHAKLKKVKTKAVKGARSAREALKMMLAGTGYEIGETPSGALTIKPSANAGAPSGEASAGTAPANDDAVAQDDRGIAEILVVGQLTQNIDIKRSEDDTQPYVVFGRKEIETAQATNLEDFLRNRLPMNTTSTSAAQETGLGSTRSNINLRGLGANQTLILVDGRRMPGVSAPAFPGGQADINGIPLGSIERVEVLPSTAGGIYGGSAVGGVINIILRRDYRGIEIKTSYNDTFDFHAPAGRLDVNGGFALEGGKTTVSFGGSLARSGTLRVGDRDFALRGRDLQLRNNPEAITNSFSAPLARGVNIRSFTTPLVLKPAYGGTALNSRITNVPDGYGGLSTLDKGAALVGNAGTYNLDIPLGHSGLERGLLSSPAMNSFNVNVRRKFTDWLDIFGDYSQFMNKGRSYASRLTPLEAVLFPDAPTNPFQQPISVRFDTPGLATPYSYRLESKRATAGFIARLPGSWSLGFDYSWSKSTNSSVYTGYTVSAVGEYCALVGIDPHSQSCFEIIRLPASDPRTILDPLLPIDFTPYLVPQGQGSQTYGQTLQTPSLRISGPLIKLPAGPVNLSASVERNITHISRGVTSDVDVLGNPYYQVFNPLAQTFTSGYAEVRAPLFSADNGLPLLRELELQASVRYDDYDTTQPSVRSGESAGAGATLEKAIAAGAYVDRHGSAKSTNFTFSGRWVPITGIALRASYGTGFLPPNVTQVAFTQETRNLGFFGDPLRGNSRQTTPYTFMVGGRSDLQPEKSKSLSIGAVITPGFLDGFRFSADYTRIRKTDEIVNANIAAILANEAAYPTQLVRAPLTDADRALGYTGGVYTLVDLRLLNATRTDLQAIDFQADYSFDIPGAGQMHLYSVASWQPELYRQPIITAPLYQYTGFNNGPLEWRGNAGFNWTLGGLSIQYNAQFYDSYKVYAAEDLQARIDLAVRNQGSRRIPSQLYHDLYLSYTTPGTRGLLGNIQIAAGIQNLFDKSPPIVASSSLQLSGYSNYGDPRMRRFTFSLKKSFGNK